MNITPAALAAINQSITTIFQGALKRAPNRFERFARRVSSDNASELYAWLDELDELREWIGPRQVQNLSARVQELENKLYESTIGIKRTHVEDDRLGIYTPRVEMLGASAAMWPEKLVVDALKAGGSTLCYDGQYFFDTDHPVDPDNAGSATQSNLHTSTALSGDNYATKRAAFASIKGRNGVPLGLLPDLLIVPPALEALAKSIVMADYVGVAVGSSAATQNNPNKGTADVLVLPRLAGQDNTWYLAHTGLPIKPLIFQERTAPEMTPRTAPDSDNVFERDEFQWGVRARGAAGYGLWQLIHKCVG